MGKVYKKRLSDKLVLSDKLAKIAIERKRVNKLILGLVIIATVISSGVSQLVPGLRGFILSAIMGFIAFFLGFWWIEKKTIIRESE